MLRKYKEPTFRSILGSSVAFENDHLGGILSGLYNSTSSVNDYLNLFTVTAYSTCAGTKESVFNPGESAYWHTCGVNQDEKWIQIEMKSIYLTITGYILMSMNACCDYPKSWRLEGRNTESENWQKIDERKGETDLIGKKLVKSFKNNVLSSCTFKIFRLTVTEDDDGGTLFLTMNEIDFFGHSSLFQFPKRTKNICFTRVCKQRSISMITSLMLVLLS